MTNPLRCPELVYALDYPSLPQAVAGAKLVGPYAGVLKVGLELFIQAGPTAVESVRQTGAKVFLDLKLHDIEKTVERSVGTACQLGASFLTIHTSGGPAMMEAAARRALTEATGLVVLGVTVLTNLDQQDLVAIGVPATPSEQVLRLAVLARESGLGGLVCSAVEVAAVRAAVGSELLLVTPGIRPAGAALGDQKRVASPSSALQAGADLLVVGRPIRDATDPAQAAALIAGEIQAARGVA